MSKIKKSLFTKRKGDKNEEVAIFSRVCSIYTSRKSLRVF